MPNGLARPVPSPLLLITDRSQARRPLVEVVEAALAGGCRWLSLREKDVSHEERVALVHDLAPRVRKFGGTLLVHTDVDAAQYADGVHLPKGSDVGEARRRLGEKAIIGLSCHTIHDVKVALGADYVTLGPFAETKSKPGYMPTLTFDEWREAASLNVPVLALGGIDETNVSVVKRTGLAGVALMGSVMRSDEPGEYVRRMVSAWRMA